MSKFILPGPWPLEIGEDCPYVGQDLLSNPVAADSVTLTRPSNVDCEDLLLLVKIHTIIPVLAKVSWQNSVTLL